MSDMFYRSFEDRHRGSVELIKSRLEIYLPFIYPFKKTNKQPKGIDLGCGRGEWLELLLENNFDILGVDLDEGMIKRCLERNLTVTKEDALSCLKNMESESLEIVSAFHFVEHVGFDSLRQLISEMYRVLKPGGLMILETPNSENLLVGTSSFYLDPTHQKPIPDLLLSFIAEHTGFIRTKTLFLQEPKNLINPMGIHSILTHVSPDYAIISQKNASPKILDLFNSVFIGKEYGNRLLGLAEKYDSQIADSFNQLTKNSVSLQSTLLDLTEKYSSLKSELTTLDTAYKIHEDKNNLALSSFFIEQKKALSYIVETLNEHSNKIQQNSEKIFSMQEIRTTHQNKETNTPNNEITEPNSNHSNITYLQQTITLLKKQLDHEQAEILHLMNKLHALSESNAYLQHNIHKFYLSRSWRYTFACRKVAHIYRKIIKTTNIPLFKKILSIKPLIYFKKESPNSSEFKDTNLANKTRILFGRTHEELSLRSTQIYLNLMKCFNNKKKQLE